MIVNYFEPVLNFNLPPEQAIAYFKQKGLKPTYSFKDMMASEHDRAFTVAKMMDIDLLDTVKQSLQEALSNGESIDTFKKKLTPILQDAGWWGKKEVINADGTVSKIQLGNSRRLHTIYRTNMQSAYAAGQWEAIQDQKDFMPYLMYDAVDDSATREEHAALDNIVRPIDDIFWTYAMPTNGYNCRCGTIQMDSDMLEQYGLSITKSKDIPTVKGFPKGVDPNFRHNPGIGFLEILNDIQNTKISKMDGPTANAAKKGVKANQKKANDIKQAKLNLSSERITMQELARIGQAKDTTELNMSKNKARKELDIIAAGKASEHKEIKKILYNKYEKKGIEDPLQVLQSIINLTAAIVVMRDDGLNVFKDLDELDL